MEKMQLKKIFNKNILKDKSFIKMICFTFVLLLVLVLGSNFGYVSASGNYDFEVSSGTNYSTYENYQNSSLYNSDALNVFNITNNSELPDISNIQSLISINYDGFTHGNNTLNLSNCPNYIVYRNSSLNRIHILFYGDGGVVSIMGGKSSFLFSGTSSIEWATVSVDTTNWTIVSADYGVTSYSAAGLTDSNLRSYCGKALGQYCTFLFSNSSVYAPLNSYYSDMGGGDNCFLWFKDFNEGAHTSFVDVNYQLADGLIGGAPSPSGGDASNYMYADYADWTLNNYTGDIAKNFKNVSVSFTSNLNDYIREHYDDTDYDAYSIWLDYNCYIDFYYQTVIDYGNLGGGVSLGSDFASVTVDYNHDMIFTNDYHWSANYIFEPTSNDSAYIDTGYLLPMDTFIEDNNCVYTLGLNNLFAYLTPSDGSGNLFGTNGTYAHTTITLYQLMNLIADNGIIWSANYDGLNQFKMTCTAKIIYDDGNGYKSSGNYIETFNLLNGTSTTDADSMLTNYNPYITNTSDSISNNLPSTSSGTSSNSLSTGNVTQTVTVTNEGGKYIPSIISSLIPSSFGDTSTGLAQRFTTLVDSNNFITVMANTVPAIPTTVWTYLTEYLGISLYLLACAFVLRLILDLL